jgi:putative multicomponent Na+:H+ antiporter subunit B
MLEAGTIILMGVFAVLAIHSKLLRLAVIHLAVLSLLAAFFYLLFAAPELAIAEAVIGSGLVTLLYLAALKRNKVYTIAVLTEGHKYRLTDAYINYMERSRALREIKHFFEVREYEPQVVFTEKPLGEALADPRFDLVIVEEKQGIATYGSDESFVVEELELMFRIHGTEANIRFLQYSPQDVAPGEAGASP